MIYVIAYLSIESRTASSFTHNMQRSTFTFIICSRPQLSKWLSHQTTAIVTTVSLLHTSHRSVLLLSFPPKSRPTSLSHKSVWWLRGEFCLDKSPIFLASLHMMPVFSKYHRMLRFFEKVFCMGCKKMIFGENAKSDECMGIWVGFNPCLSSFGVEADRPCKGQWWNGPRCLSDKVSSTFHRKHHVLICLF